MSTRLERLAARVHAAFAADLAGTPAKFGLRETQKHQEKRCVVWVSPGGDVNPAQRTNGTITTETGKPERISIVADRLEQIEAHIYAVDAERVELLLDAVIAALHQEFGPNAPYPWKYEWFGGSQDAGVANTRPKVILKFAAKMPVSERALGLRTVVGFQHGHAAAPDKPHTDPH